MNDFKKIEFYDIENSIFYWSPFAISNLRNNKMKWINSEKNEIWNKIYEPILFSNEIIKLWKEWFFDSNNIIIEKKVLTFYHNKNQTQIINIFSQIIWKKKIGKLSFFTDQLFLDYPFYDFVLRKYIELISKPMNESKLFFEKYYPILFYSWNQFISKQKYDLYYQDMKSKIETIDFNSKNVYDILNNYEDSILIKYDFLEKKATLLSVKQDLTTKLSIKKNTNEYKKYLKWFQQIHDEFLQYKSSNIILNEKNKEELNSTFQSINDNEMNNEDFNDYSILQKTELNIDELNMIKKIENQLESISLKNNKEINKDRIFLQNDKKFMIKEQKLFLMELYENLNDISFGEWKGDEFINYLILIEFEIFTKMKNLNWNKIEFQNKVNEIILPWLSKKRWNELQKLLEIYSYQKELLIDYNYNFIILKNELDKQKELKIKERIISLNNSLNAFYLFYHLFHKLIDINIKELQNVIQNTKINNDIDRNNNVNSNDGSCTLVLWWFTLFGINETTILISNETIIKLIKQFYDNNYLNDKKYIQSEFERFFKFEYQKNNKTILKVLSYNEISFHLFLKELIIQELWISKNIIQNYDNENNNFIVNRHIDETISFYNDFWILMQEEIREFKKLDKIDYFPNEIDSLVEYKIEYFLNKTIDILEKVKKYDESLWFEGNNIDSVKFNCRDEWIWNYLFENSKESFLIFWFKQKSLKDSIEKMKILIDECKTLWKPSFDIKINKNNLNDIEMEWLEKVYKLNDPFTKELSIIFKYQIKFEFERLRIINEKSEEYFKIHEIDNWQKYKNDLDYQLYQIPKNLC